MSKTAINLLLKWIVKVMTMICSNAHMFSHNDRKELAHITSELEKLLRAEVGK